jgi:6-phosphogluconate dehydrogenase (decarboxylating)
MKAQITLTPSESKRLIAKAVKAHEKVRNALKNGIVAIGLGSTNALVVEEILGRKIEKERYVAGMIDERGTCVVPGDKRLREVILEKGMEIEEKIEDAVKRMGPTDVFIKGANAINYEWTKKDIKYGIAGVMLASETGGTIGEVLGILKARGVNIIMPVGLEKFVPYPITEISKKIGIYKMNYSTGIPVGMMPVSGELITELEAIELLTGASAIPIGSGGIGGGEGSKTFLIEGDEKGVKKAINIVENLKGEANVKALRGSCLTCVYKQCPSSGREKDI